MSKPLNHICWQLAAKVLGKPGTIVECMSEKGDVFLGERYTVSKKCGPFLEFKEKSYDSGWYATRFRKVSP